MPSEGRLPAANVDREQGIFESVLVVGGRPIRLEAHLARMARSLRDLPASRSDHLIAGHRPDFVVATVKQMLDEVRATP